jgi:Uma2 family endonuclease
MPGNDAMKPLNPGVKLTYDDFVLFPDDGKRHELIDGEHYVTPSPNTRHQQVSGDLFASIWMYLEANPRGRLKRRLYERVGVSEYWAIDPETNVVRIYRRTTGGFNRAIELSRDASDVLTTPLLPGLTLPLTRLLRD